MNNLPSRRTISEVNRISRPVRKNIGQQKAPTIADRRRLISIWKNPLVLCLLSVALTLLVVGAIVHFRQHRAPETQLKQVLGEVGQIMYLPNNETPTLATVSDQSKLQGTLKSVAKTGDDVLVYQRHGEVIVYRPSAHKIAAVEPLLIGNQPNAALTSTVAILNGSGSDAELQKFVTSLYQEYPNVKLVYKANAPRLFPKTIVFAKQLNDPVADEVAKGLSIQSGQAPLGVANGLADLTFIIGQDF